MNMIKGFFVFLYNTISLISGILGIWAVIKSPEEVKGTLISWFNYFRSITTTKQPMQGEKPEPSVPPEGLSEEDQNLADFINSTLDSSHEMEFTSDAKRRSGKRYAGYLYVIGALVVIPILITNLISHSAATTETGIASPRFDWTSTGGMNIVSIFWLFICLFGFIGAMRGWAREMLVVFSGMLALAANYSLVKYLPFLTDLPENSLSLFWMHLIVIVTLVYFGYQVVASVPALAARSTRERLSDTLFGIFVGGVNGYLIAGTVLAYFHAADYPFKYIIAPATDANFSEIVTKMMAVMPPNLLGEPSIYLGVIIMFVFVLVVYA